jgi:hypothetical protein
MKNLSIEERIERSGLFDFSDGYLGSTGHGACYYNNDVEGINDIKSEEDLKCIILDDFSNDNFDKWFGDCDEFEIIEDSINGGNGYGKIIVNKEERFIKIIVVPCLYSGYSSNKDSDIKIFGFDFDNGELIREIDEDKLNEILKDKDYYIG